MSATFLKSLLQNAPKPKLVLIYAFVAPIATLCAVMTALKEEPEWFNFSLLTGLAIFYWYAFNASRTKKRNMAPHDSIVNTPDTSDHPKSGPNFQIALGSATTLLAILGFSDEWSMGAIWALVAAPLWFSVYVNWWDHKFVNRPNSL